MPALGGERGKVLSPHLDRAFEMTLQERGALKLYEDAERGGRASSRAETRRTLGQALSAFQGLGNASA
jgi:hypothetical protein